MKKQEKETRFTLPFTFPKAIHRIERGRYYAAGGVKRISERFSFFPTEITLYSYDPQRQRRLSFEYKAGEDDAWQWTVAQHFKLPNMLFNLRVELIPAPFAKSVVIGKVRN